tara:strand:+ start:11705 stop:11827 length:123 start_codon:yes stop_codon:yes gene_type:complete
MYEVYVREIHDFTYVSDGDSIIASKGDINESAVPGRKSLY